MLSLTIDDKFHYFQTYNILLLLCFFLKWVSGSITPLAPFTDGNKRIGAFMFIWFLPRNKHHLKKNGEPKINDNALVAITLLVAQSEPCQKEIMVELIINLFREELDS